MILMKLFDGLELKENSVVKIWEALGTNWFYLETSLAWYRLSNGLNLKEIKGPRKKKIIDADLLYFNPKNYLEVKNFDVCCVACDLKGYCYLQSAVMKNNCLKNLSVYKWKIAAQYKKKRF